VIAALRHFSGAPASVAISLPPRAQIAFVAFECFVVEIEDTGLAAAAATVPGFRALGRERFPILLGRLLTLHIDR
jgi:hypothetical protein